MEIDYNSLISAARGGVWNAVFGSMGVCVFALLISRIEILSQRMSLKATTIAYRGPRIGRGLALMGFALAGFVVTLWAVWSRADTQGLSDAFSKMLASSAIGDQLLVALVAATAIFFDIGVFVFLMAEQRVGAR